MRYSALLAALLFSSLLAACDVPANQISPHFDHAADELPFPVPALTGFDTFPQAPALPQDAVERLRLQRAFFTSDFSTLDSVLNVAHQRHVDGDDNVAVADAFLENIKTTGLAGIDACKAWLAEKPGSYAAHLVCGALWRNGAWVARGGDYANKVTPVRFALMRERLARSNALLEKAVTLSAKPVEALTLLADNRLAVSERDAARVLLAQAASIMPAYVPLHDTRIQYAQAEWGGSPDEVAAGIALAKNAGVDEDALAYFQDHYVACPCKMSDPGAERTYWEKAIAERPTVDRLRSLADYFNRMQNWRDGLPAAARLIDKAPSDAKAYWLRGAANEKLGHIPEALADYRMAAAQGYDFATQTLIQAYVQGGLGLGSKNWDPHRPRTAWGRCSGKATG
jgi:tetratricopeptide (TPR) repeat protein